MKKTLEVEGLLGLGSALVVDLPHGFDLKAELINARSIKLATAFAHWTGWKHFEPHIAKTSANVKLLKRAFLLPNGTGCSLRLVATGSRGPHSGAAVLLLLTYRLFAERPKTADFYRRQYKYVCIDEAQDLNEAQYRLLVSLCGSEFTNVMMVGDPRQAIYVWNGADPKYLDLFQRDFKAKKIELTENFRCSKAVVAAAQRLDSSYTVEGQLPIEGTVELIECEDEPGEAHAVIEQIRSLESTGHPDIEGDITLSRCAVLGRNRFVFGSLQDELKQRGISFYKKLSAATYQSESDVVEQFELALRLLANPRDRLHLDILAKAWGAPMLAEDAPISSSTPCVACAHHSGKILSTIPLASWQHPQYVIIRFMRLHGAEPLLFLALLPLLLRIQDEWLNRCAPAQGNDRIFVFWLCTMIRRMFVSAPFLARARSCPASSVRQ